MKKLNKMTCLAIIVCLTLSLTGCCGKKTNTIYDSEPSTVVKETTEDDKIDVEKIVEKAKEYIVQNGCMENVTKAEWVSIEKSTRDDQEDSVTKTRATLESGFNKDFYYIIEESEKETVGYSNIKKSVYTFYMDDEWGFVNYENKDYKIISDIVLAECELKDLHADTLSEMIISEIILEPEYCSLEEDEEFYIIEQRLAYQDLAINKANSCSFSAFDEDMSIRQILKFKKDTFALVQAEVICAALDVERGTEDTLTVNTVYSYEQTHEYDSSMFEEKDITEIDSFRGYSIY